MWFKRPILQILKAHSCNKIPFEQIQQPVHIITVPNLSIDLFNISNHEFIYSVKNHGRLICLTNFDIYAFVEYTDGLDLPHESRVTWVTPA